MATTLELLEWSRLSQQVATFANTGAAREILEAGLPVRLAREASELLHIETEEMWTLEQVLAKPIDLRSFINIDPLVRYAQKGGELDGAPHRVRPALAHCESEPNLITVEHRLGQLVDQQRRHRSP
jgi:dsDNA-specific endonuclease/ATPase MutS2